MSVPPERMSRLFGISGCCRLLHLIRRLEALGRAANAVAGGCHEHELAEGVALETLTAAEAADITGEAAAQPDLLRDNFGNPFHQIAIDPRWLTSNVADLVNANYTERAFDRMPILADALMDAGCDDEEIIAHCRGKKPGEREKEAAAFLSVRDTPHSIAMANIPRRRRADTGPRCKRLSRPGCLAGHRATDESYRALRAVGLRPA